MHCIIYYDLLCYCIDFLFVFIRFYYVYMWNTGVKSSVKSQRRNASRGRDIKRKNVKRHQIGGRRRLVQSYGDPTRMFPKSLGNMKTDVFLPSPLQSLHTVPGEPGGELPTDRISSAMGSE